jgi:plastocyanin
MRKLLTGTALALAAVVPLALGATGALASTTAAKSKPPVKLSGKVNVTGTQTAVNGAITIRESDFKFDPTFIKVPKGTTTITVSVTNTDNDPHTFTIPAQNLDTVVNPGQTATVTVTVPSKGALAFYCHFHKQLGMQGAFFDKNGAKVVAATSTGSSGSGSPATTSGSSRSGGSGGYGY